MKHALFLLSFFSFFFVGSHAADGDIYRCSMHPWITSTAPGKCTLCGMALTPGASTQGHDTHAHHLTLSAPQITAAGVATDSVAKGTLRRTLRVSGVVEDDDTRHRIIAARVPGRVEKLYVNYVGARVKAGEPLAVVYSPEMLTAQRTYVERLRGNLAYTVSERAAAREKLLELGLTEEEVGILERTLEPTAMVNIRAPISGTVVSRNVYEGQQINRANSEGETRLFEIGDFGRMWFVFDVYEQDLALIREGQEVDVRLDSLPGETLRATISFIDPNLDPLTRTARARVILENSHGRIYHRQTGTGVIAVETPGALLLPRSAVLQHSGRAIVFVALNDGYEAREVALGKSGDHAYEVLAGVHEGEKVVTQGTLLLDSQAHLAQVIPLPLATEEKSQHPPAHRPAESYSMDEYQALLPLGNSLAALAESLASDDLDAYRQGIPEAKKSLQEILVNGPESAKQALQSFATATLDGADLRAARRAFEPLSTAVADLFRGAPASEKKLHVFQCPMTPVLGNGRWLSHGGEVRNPFFGSAMLECGEALE